MNREELKKELEKHGYEIEDSGSSIGIRQKDGLDWLLVFDELEQVVEIQTIFDTFKMSVNDFLNFSKLVEKRQNEGQPTIEDKVLRAVKIYGKALIKEMWEREVPSSWINEIEEWMEK